MSLPAGVATRPVRLAPPVNHAGDPLTVRVSIEPSHTVIHAATGTALTALVTDNTAAPGATLTLNVPVTDQPGFIDTAGNVFAAPGWAYTARIQLVDAQGKSRYLLKKFSVPGSLTDLDLMMVPSGSPAVPVTTTPPAILSVAGATGVVTAEQIADAQGLYFSWAADPSRLWTGTVTRNTDGAATSAAILWPDGVTGTYTGTPSTTHPGAVDAYTLTHGTTTYTQPPVTRDTAGNITNQPAITAA